MNEVPVTKTCNQSIADENYSDTKSILVTGGTGLVGSHLLKQLSHSGKKIKAIYRNTEPNFNAENIEWIQCDILDVIALEQVMSGVEQVYHCAAIVSFSKKKKQEMYVVNVDGTTNIVNTCLKTNVQKICYVSSVAVLGKTTTATFIDENIPNDEIALESDYAKSKYLAEIEVWRAIGEGLDAVIVNPSIILGGSDWNRSSTRIFKSSYDEFPWYTNGVAGFVDVHDVAHAMIQLMNSSISSERFIISSGNYSFREISSKIAARFQKNPPDKLAMPWMVRMVTIYEGLKALISQKEPLITQETAKAAQSTVLLNNNKLKQFLPSFDYSSVDCVVERVCKEIQLKHSEVKSKFDVQTLTG